MMILPSLTLPVFLGALAITVRAAPARESRHAIGTRQAITALSSSQISSFKPFTFFASAGNCQPSATLSWDCGENCDANPTFRPIASGGDGDSTQFWFVGFDPTHNTVIVSHQGTNSSEILPLLTDFDIFQETLDPTLFPGINSSVEVHSGFAAAQSKAATSVLSAVQTAMSQYGTTSVTLVGHSLGAAISLLDSVYLPLYLPSTTTFTTVLYGLPLVGNQAFADYVDANLHVTHINNKKDGVPILPGVFLGFVQPSGEVHIEDSGEWANCPGQDNPSDQCIMGDVPNIFESDDSDHNGPYDGVENRLLNVRKYPLVGGT